MKKQTTGLGFIGYICLCVPCFNVSNTFGLVLVDNGKTQAVIVTAPDAPDSVRLAASELQTYLSQSMGAMVPIRTSLDANDPSIIPILVGESSATRARGLSTEGLKSDGYTIVIQDCWMAILGRDYRGQPISGMRDPWLLNQVYNAANKVGAFGETGTLFGMYRFLEEFCGVRWYMPGELGTVVPKRTTLAVAPRVIKISPDFEYRYPWFCNFDISPEDALWYRRAGFGTPYPVQINHSFYMFLPYQTSHPEYFALIGGKRDFTNLSCLGGMGNLCLSNPDVAKQWIETINDYFDKNPNQFIFPLCPMDGMVKICECAKCQAQIDLAAGETGKFSNYVWSFVDRVAKGVAGKHPDKFVGCFAYDTYNLPPVKLKKLSSNVAVMICKTRGSYVDKKYQDQMRHAVTGWAEKTHNIYNWEYYLYSWLPWRGLPVFFPHLISDDLKSLKGISKGEFIEAESPMPHEVGKLPLKLNFPGMQHLNLYVTAKVYWDADLDVDQLVKEYCEKFYGPGGKDMKGFWKTAEDLWMTKGARGTPVNIYKKDDLDKLTSCLENAKKKTEAGSAYRKRVELIEGEFLPARRALSNVLVQNPPKITVPGSSPAVRLDGVLDDPAWKDAQPLGFVDKNGETARFKTWGYAAWDEENLYLAFLNYEPEMKKLTARDIRKDQRDGPMWEDDSMEIFICPDPKKRKKCYQFIVNANGAVWDGIHGRTPFVDATWNSGAEAKTKLEPNRWVAEIKIPFKDLGIKGPVEGKTLAVNLYRNRYCGNPVTYSCWSPTLAAHHFTTERFGEITFKKVILTGHK